MTPPNALGPRGDQPTVLLVDDSRDLRALVGHWLEDVGFEVLTAASAEEAIWSIQQYAVDVALCDVMLPGHDGIWLAREISALSPNTQVIFSTALESLPGSETLRPGIFGYLVKPLSQDRLIGMVLRACAASSYIPERHTKVLRSLRSGDIDS